MAKALVTIMQEFMERATMSICGKVILMFHELGYEKRN